MSIKTNTTSLQSLLEQVNSLPDAGGVELPTLTNEGSASDLLSGKELIDQEGNVVTGTIETKTASDLATSGAMVTVPAGHYASQATKSVDTATQATPNISVDSNGLITASATQAAGYVAAGTKSGTKQLTTQAAKTVTPTKSSQTAVSSGVYTTGAVTVAPIPSEYITTTDATAEASEIMSGETAYVNGSKVTGTFTIDSEISNINSLVDQIQTALDGKAAGGGVELPELSNPATAEEVFANKELIDADGNKIVGTFTIDNELNAQDDLIAQIQAAVDGLPDAGSDEPTLQSKTVTPTTSSQTVTADSGYDGLSSVMVNGDDNLVAENIVSGVSIFGVEGSASASGGGSASVETCSVEFALDAPTGGAVMVYYTDSNMNYCTMSYSETTISVPKNTIIALDGWSSMSYSSGDCTQLFYGLGGGDAAYIITGNCTITYA